MSTGPGSAEDGVQPADGVTKIASAAQYAHDAPPNEYTLAAQSAMVVSDVNVQAAVTRWPGPAVEQAEHVGFAPATDA